MSLLTRDQILRAEDCGTRDVAAFGGTVRVRGLTLLEQEELEQLYGLEQSERKIRARMVSWCVIDEHGKRVFTAEDVPALEQRSARSMLPLWRAIVDLSGLSQKGSDELGKA